MRVGSWSNTAIWVGFLVLLSFSPRPVGAETTVVEDEEGDHVLTLSGYARLISGYQHLDYGAPSVADQRGLNMGVGRLQWRAEFGPDVTARVDHELTWNLQTEGGGAGAGGLFGVDASRTGARTFDLEQTLLEESGMRATHEVDRLAVDVYAGDVDLTVGRQGITWGYSNLFPVADLWSRFSPFDFDTEQKPGVDAARALIYPNLASELDLVVADRGSLEDLSVGARYASTVGQAELYGAAGKFWEEVLALAGVSFVWDRVKVRAEAVGPFDLEEEAFQLPRLTTGGEWYGSKVTLGAEYHFNGIGAGEPADYAAQFGSEEFNRGESYFLGRHYAGVYGSYRGIPDVQLDLSTIANLGDPSLIVSPMGRYEVAQNATIGVGALVSAGEVPELRPLPRLRSEFGAYGNFVFAELAAYF